MNFTAKQKAEIRYYLGYQPYHHSVDNILDRDYEANLVAIIALKLVSLVQMEESLVSFAIQGSPTKVDVIEFAKGQTDLSLRSLKKSLSDDIARALGLTNYSADFSLNKISIIST